MAGPAYSWAHQGTNMLMTYITAGFGVGLLVGMTGVGGGSLMTPLLTLLFGALKEANG